MPLRERNVNLRHGQALKSVWFHVTNDSHHFPWSIHVEHLARRVFTTEIATREGLIDDHDPFGLFCVLFRERPPSHHRDLQDSEVIGTDAPHACDLIFYFRLPSQEKGIVGLTAQ